jgi:hypothetical protein
MVAVVGSIQTSKRERDGGKTDYYETAVGRELVIL